MTTQTLHRLAGLEPDSLLAFLALVGILRALELSRPDWYVRTYWDFGSAPLRPVLKMRDPTSQAEVCAAAIDGIRVYRKALAPFSWPRSKGGDNSKAVLPASTHERLRTLQRRALMALLSTSAGSSPRQVWSLRCELLCALGVRSSGFKGGKKQTFFESSPMKLTSGQMAFVGAQFDVLSCCTEAEVSDSLFSPWSYRFNGASLRLSAADARRYAYRSSDPAPEGTRTEVGATALASLGLLALVMSEGTHHWRMVGYAGRRQEGILSWPLWNGDGGGGATYQGVLALWRSLSQGSAGNRQRSTTHQITAIASAGRFVLDPNQGDYGNVARATITMFNRPAPPTLSPS